MDFVENFIKKTPNNSVVLLDGIEYLSSYIDFTQLLESLHYMNEVATKNGAIVIIPLTPEAFVHEDKTLLEKDTEIIEAQ
jgi:archaellum biogenesis ATPase FlaH